jgi:hypothetical protein
LTAECAKNEENRITRLQVRNTWADRLNSASSFVPEHCGSDEWEFAEHVMQIAVADASGRNANEYFTLLWWINLDLVDF